MGLITKSMVLKRKNGLTMLDFSIPHLKHGKTHQHVVTHVAEPALHGRPAPDSLLLVSWQVLLLKHRSGGRGLQKSMTDVPLEHHEECACVCSDDWDWPHTRVAAATGITQHVKKWTSATVATLCASSTSAGELQQDFPPLSYCPLANWMEQNKLESNKTSESIRLLWNTNRETQIHWSRSGLLPMCPEDYFPQLLWDKSIEASSSRGLF